MAIRGAVTLVPSLAVARLALAAVLTTGSVTAMYVGCVWLIAEVTHLLYPRWLLAIATGLVAYAVIGAGVWMVDPNTAVEDSPGAEFRPVMSASWSAGLLLEAGAFSDYSCGY